MQKKYIVIISIFVIYMLTMVLIFGTRKAPIATNTYLIIGENTRWFYDKDGWHNLEIQDETFDSKEFKVYKDQVYQGDYYLQNYNDTWYFFDEDNNSYDLYGQLFAYASEDDINVIKYDVKTVELSEINELLENYNIVINDETELSELQKISIDFDGDDELENIYSISNLMAENMKGEEFSLVLYVDGNKKNEIIKKMGNTKYTHRVSNIIDFNNDQSYEIIIEQQMPMNPSKGCHSMYQLKNKKYELLKSCN